MIYAADDGHLVTVANFASSILDLPYRSSANDADRSYVANTTKIRGWHTRHGSPLSPPIHARSSPVNPAIVASPASSHKSLSILKIAIANCRSRIKDQSLI